jgi:hypothetical protein
MYVIGVVGVVVVDVVGVVVVDVVGVVVVDFGEPIVKVAITVSLPFIVIVVGLAVVLTRSLEPLQLLKVQPVSGIAVNCTELPTGQKDPGGFWETLPEPSAVTVRLYPTPMQLANVIRNRAIKIIMIENWERLRSFLHMGYLLISSTPIICPTFSRNPHEPLESQKS